MSETFILLISILLAGGLGTYIGLTLSKLKHKSQTGILEDRHTQLGKVVEELKIKLKDLEEERDNIRRERENLNSQLASRNVQYENLKEQHEQRESEFLKQQEQIRKDFELLANKILEEKSEKFTLQNKENIKNILTPLQEKIKTFEDKVDKTQKESISMHSALKEQLLGLKDLNIQMTKEATNLTRALKGDSKMQGNWGELVLERVLEKSGLETDREYFVQQSYSREDGSRVMPDVILYLPDNKRMVIDSKVSLVDYERYVNAEEDERPIFLRAHVNSIKKHVDQLSAKNYQDIYDIESPDFVLLFVPIEPAFACAINEDNSLYNRAFDKNIVIVTPATLLATLRTVDTMWNNEKQQRNALEIAKQAGALYDKFESFVSDLTGVGKKLDSAKSDYSAAMNKLVMGKGNLVGRVEKLKRMGAKAKKSLPEVILKRAQDTDD